MEARGRRAYRIVVGLLTCLCVIAGAYILSRINEVTNGTATLTYVQRFTRCGDTAQSVVEMPANELAGTLGAVAAGWTVAESKESSATVQKEVDGFCSLHENFRYIALYRGSPAEKLHVCVFRGNKASPNFLVKERRDLTEDALYPQDRERLRIGIQVTLVDTDPPDMDLDEKTDAYLQGVGMGR